jgi:glycerol-3-phosphate dehydrogenase (NAD(P)+)
MKLAIIGAGRLARGAALILGKRTSIRLWARSEQGRREVAAELPNVEVTADLGRAVDGAELVFLAVPAGSMLDAADQYGKYAKGDHLVLTASRGVGPGFALPHQMIRAKTCVRKIAAFGGPLHTRELALGRQLSAVLASRFSEPVAAVRELVRGGPLTIHASKDIVGVEVAGAISNAAHFAAGMADALELGETARGVLLTHGLIEARRLGLALGASPETFSGLAGVGDLIPRKVTSTERHHAAAKKFVETGSLEEALKAADGHVEGVSTAREAAKLGADRKIDLPLMRAVAAVLDGEASPREALESILRLAIDL